MGDGSNTSPEEQRAPGDADTYHTWPWVGHPALVGTPLVMGALSVGKGPVEDLPDVGHAVHTDSRAPENVAAMGTVGSAEPCLALPAVGTPTTLSRPGEQPATLGDSDRAGHGQLQLDVPRGWSCTTHLTVLKRA